MPPKKLAKSNKNVQVKSIRRRPRKRTCSPIIETEEKISNSQPNSASTTHNVQQKDIMVKVNKNDLNIILANEVVRRQFQKKSTIMKETEIQVSQNLNQSKVKSLGIQKSLQKKNKEDNNKVPNGDTIMDSPLMKRCRRRVMPKKYRVSPEPVLNCENVDSSNSDNEIVAELNKNQTKKRVTRKRSKTVTQPNLVENKTSVENYETTKPNITRRKLSYSRLTAKGRPSRRNKGNNVLKEIEAEEITPDNIDTTLKRNIDSDPSNIGNEQDIRNVRRNSSSSELSWTKDISSSSTTTCVTVSSADFFRIDKKIPILKLTNINFKFKGEENNNICEVNDKLCTTETTLIEYNDKSQCNDNDIIENLDKSKEKNCDDEIDFPCPPNLSSASSSGTCSDKLVECIPVTVNEPISTLKKLSSKLKSLDLEIINWIGYENENTNSNVEILQEKLFQDNFLKEEMNVIINCQNIKRILSDNHNTETDENKTANDIVQSDNENENLNDINLNEPHNPTNDECNRRINRDSICNERDKREDCSNTIEEIERSKEMETVNVTKEDLSLNNVRNVSLDDDDDALSLFAESITGIDSSKNSSVGLEQEYANFENFVPQPRPENISQSLQNKTANNIENTQADDLEDGVQVNVCEKQSADSTSISKELDNDNIHGEKFYEDKQDGFDQVSNKQNSASIISQGPSLMASIHQTIPGIKSFLFKGICFFNLISYCKKSTCKFPHVDFVAEDIKNKLKMLTDDVVIKEYMLIRSWPVLRRKYGMCFVEECIKRKLTRILVEIAIDFIMKASSNFNFDNVLTIDVVENVLLYMNIVDLHECEDLLQYNIKTNTVLLCDFFINTIAESQNFSRFKSVFVNLINFMYSIGRPFHDNVAKYVLERVVILPYDEGLAQALLKIIKNTGSGIFCNSMIGKFEQQLLSSNAELCEEFRTLKDQVIKSQMSLGNHYTNTQLLNEEVDRSNINTKHLDKDIRYSPDTTNLDTLNKKSMKKEFKRTIDYNKLQFLGVNGHMANPTGCDVRRFPPENKFKNWRNRNSYDNQRHVPRNQIMRPPLRPPLKRRSDQNFGGSPKKYQRRNEQNNFRNFS